MSTGQRNPISRGDIVLMSYPFSDRSGGKIRPCLIVQNDSNNGRLHDTIVVSVRSRIQFAQTDPTQVLVDIATADGKQTGLLHTSAIYCENIATIDQALVLRRIGHLPASLMQQVDDALKTSLALT